MNHAWKDDNHLGKEGEEERKGLKEEGRGKM